MIHFRIGGFYNKLNVSEIAVIHARMNVNNKTD